MGGHMDEKAGIGARKGHRAVHVVNRQPVCHAVSETFIPARRSVWRMGRFGLPRNR